MTIRRSTTASLAALAALATTLGVAGCSTAVADSAAGTSPTSPSPTSPSSSSTTAQVAQAGTLWDATLVHTIAIDVDEAELAAMIETYLASGEKEWITATVTIDGETFQDVGIKLKGNSSLRDISADTPAQELPWRIRLDKVVDGQNLDGYTDLVIRSNSSESSLNEFVALDLLGAAGLASEQAIATRVSVNGSQETLQLTLQNLDDTWLGENFETSDGDVLYKAEAQGTWDWLGTGFSQSDGTGEAYASSFDIEAGADDFAPLAQLLELVNTGTAQEIAAELPALLDVESFARYLAFEELIANTDDIDGPGNNSYLYWDSSQERFTVVAWDHNMAFGTMPGGAGGGGFGGATPGGAMPGGEMPEGERPGMPAAGELPTDFPTDLPTDFPSDGGGFPGGGQGGPGGMGGNNPLVAAFTANEEWNALIEQARTDLTAELLTSGALTASVDAWSAVLTEGASDLIDPETLEQEAASLRSYAD